MAIKFLNTVQVDTDVLYVDTADDRVGIGTDNPDVRLHVNGGGGILVNNGGGDAVLSANSNTGIFSIGDTDGLGDGVYATNTGTSYFDIYSDSSVRFRMDSNGNVGIGTGTSGLQAKLAVAGTVHVGQDFEVSDGLGGDKTLAIDAPSGAFRIGDIDGIADEAHIEGDGERIKIFNGGSLTLITDSNQNVGIGAPVPSQKLHVNGNARLTGLFYDGSNSGGTAGQILSSDGGQTEWIDGSAIPGVPAGSGTTNYLARWTPDGNTLGIGVTYDNGTNVGIGTTSPGTYKLAVAGSTAIGGNVEVLDGLGGDRVLSLTANNGYFSIGDIDGLGDQAFISGDSSSISISTNQTTTLHCDSNNRVGIGTDIPGAKLDVVQSTAANGAAALHLIGPQSNPGLTSSVLIIEQSDGKKITIDGNDIDVSSGDLFINDYSREDVTFGGQIKVNGGGTPVGDSYFANGNVGVATTNPRTKLHVSGLTSDDDPALGSSTAPLFISNASDSYGLNVGVNNVGASWLQAQSNTSSTAYEMSLNPLGGNVGVGLINPGFKLDVNGEIHSSTYVSATSGLGVDNTVGTLGRGISLYGGPSLYPQYGLLFAKTSNLGTYGGVSGDWATYMTMSGTSTRGWIWKAGTVDSTAGNVASISGVGQLTLASTATATNFILSSDETLKDNIKEIDTKHVDVDWKNFELKSEPGIKRAGVIAQELEIKHPEFVRTADDGLKSVAYIDLLITKIAELEARLEKLEK